MRPGQANHAVAGAAQGRIHAENHAMRRGRRDRRLAANTGKPVRRVAPPRRCCICSYCRRVIPTRLLCLPRKRCESKKPRRLAVQAFAHRPGNILVSLPGCSPGPAIVGWIAAAGTRKMGTSHGIELPPVTTRNDWSVGRCHEIHLMLNGESDCDGVAGGRVLIAMCGLEKDCAHGGVSVQVEDRKWDCAVAADLILASWEPKPCCRNRNYGSAFDSGPARSNDFQAAR